MKYLMIMLLALFTGLERGERTRTVYAGAGKAN
ncbi:Uncharacterised protein [Citrobacter koseri]|uniref:Uncharacterized protein n=1 Tax=Citrobacter koseri TaxID=545 RepID=A0A2X2VE76_CITKO|nr:Uncharacterised protein [Citrobacter koseri]